MLFSHVKISSFRAKAHLAIGLYIINNYISRKSIAHGHFQREILSSGYPTKLENYGNSRGGGGYFL